MNSLKTIELIIYISAFIATTVISSCIPLFSDEAHIRNIPDSIIGLTLIANPVAQVISTYYLGPNMETSKKKYQLRGIVLLSIGSFGFGLIYLIDNNFLFIFLAIITRLISGIGDSSYYTSTFSILTCSYKDEELDSKISVLETVISSGFFTGYCISSIFYSLGGYMLTFFATGISLLFMLFMIQKFIPDQFNEADSKPTNLLEYSKGEQHQQEMVPLNENHQNVEITNADSTLTYLQILKKDIILAVFLSNTVASIATNFFGPILAPYIYEKLKLDQNYAGYLYSFEEITFLPFSLVVPFVISFLGGKREMLIIGGLLLGGSGVLLFGPAQFFQPFLQTSFWLIGIGQMVLGLGQAFVYIPTLSEYSTYIKELNHDLSESKLSDLSSGLFQIGYSIGEGVGPLMGGFLASLFGFQTATVIMSIFCFLIGIYHIQIARRYQK